MDICKYVSDETLVSLLVPILNASKIEKLRRPRGTTPSVVVVIRDNFLSRDGPGRKKKLKNDRSEKTLHGRVRARARHIKGARADATTTDVDNKAAR